ncbi:branched-chain-amino-acid aminotransferase-like protein 1 isoform X2 [Amaranthus tricolor]|uniref:branched-chain-amino-acid aminotransferase-like protein 1 isoform X2 n=1 Tax=Amaranthus tricolor TaxID=29722 RepID=UPI00258B943B|nr:branched-chain-amino-acid aminotransferase-like protein 1 isoform X2 [Amaranthus tricolor]
MSKQGLPKLSKDLLKKGKHFILIRNPTDVLASFDKDVPPTILEIGLAALVTIYIELSDQGNPPTIIDAGELQRDPEG